MKYHEKSYLDKGCKNYFPSLVISFLVFGMFERKLVEMFL